MPRFIAPAGTRITYPDLIVWLGRALSGVDDRPRFTQAMAERYNIQPPLMMSSGRAAMTLIMQTLRGLSDGERDEVIIPAYNCYSVAASASLAGLKLRPCDIDPATLDYRWDKLEAMDFSRVLAVTSANLYGLPNDLPRLAALCKERGVFFIDDAAQAMHAAINGRYAGTFGDVGIYSLDKGKNMTTIQGGLIRCDEPRIREPLAAAVDALPTPNAAQTIKEAVQLLAYSVLLHPALYWLPQRAMSLGETPWETDYPRTRYSRFLSPMAATLFQRIDAITDTRRRNAEALLNALDGSPWQAIQPLANVQPAYPRLPLLASDAGRRDDAIRHLIEAGYGATGSYPKAIPDVPEVMALLVNHGDDFSGARDVARRIVTLPTQAYLRPADIQAIADILKR